MLNTLYVLWGVLWVLVGFILTMPINMIFLSFKRTYPIAHAIRKLWAYIIFIPLGLRVKVIGQEHIDSNQKYIFAPNHSSYIDIPTCTIALPGVLCFMAKKELAKIPLFGYYFRTIDIGVKRQEMRNAYQAFIKMGERLDQGQTPLIYPEGTIPAKAPQLGNFKIGAFRLAIEKGIPIVPVTMPNNAQCFPDQKPIRLNRQDLKVIIHRPIPTTNLKAEDAPQLMKEVFHIIESELNSHQVIDQ